LKESGDEIRGLWRWFLGENEMFERRYVDSENRKEGDRLAFQAVSLFSTNAIILATDLSRILSMFKASRRISISAISLINTSLIISSM